MTPDDDLLRADAWVLGARLELSALPGERLVARGPNTYELGEGRILCAFRYGALVFFGTPESEQEEWARRLAPHVEDGFAAPARDELDIRARPGVRPGLDADGVLQIDAPSIERLQAIAHVLAKSTVLSHYEERVAEEWSRVEARMSEVDTGPGRRRTRRLLEDIRRASAIQAEMVGRIETIEKPEIVWDAPELDRLYELLAVEFELRDRDAALARKLHFILDGASTALDLIHTRQGLRVEWYIVILIAIEIVLIVYDIWGG